MEWIKLSKENPVLGRFVIATDGHHVGECIFAPNDDFIIMNLNWVSPWGKVIAWMPLPHPPKGDE